MGLSGGEIFLVILVALILFGAKGIPDIARGLAKGMKEFKKAADEIKEEISKEGTLNEIKEIKNDFETKISSSIENPLNEVKKDIDNQINN